MARGRAFPKQAQQSRSDETDAPHCPLCIEVLDSHEQGWHPCQCGYQVCAFCYQRLQLENNQQCPGCRTVYGAVPQDIPGREAQPFSSPAYGALAKPISERGEAAPQRADLEAHSDTSGSPESHLNSELASNNSYIDDARPSWGQRLRVGQENNPASTSQQSPEDRFKDPIVSYPLKGARQMPTISLENPASAAVANFGATQQRTADLKSNGPFEGPSALPIFDGGEQAGSSPEEGAPEEGLDTPESEQTDLWEKLLSAPRPRENAEASHLRRTISQAVTEGGLSPKEGASKLVACLQDMVLNGSATSPSQAVPMRPLPTQEQPLLTQSQPSSDFTLSPRSLPKPPPEPLMRRPEARREVAQVIAQDWMGTAPSPFGARQTDVEVPAPKKKTALSGEEKLRSWLTEGVKVAAPQKNHQQPLNGFVHASHPAVPGPSRENRFSAHGAIGDSIQVPPGASQLQHQQSNLGVAPMTNGNESLWGPLSKQSSSSSFWGGHQLEADPVPESVQELWADKGRMESRLDFRPASQEQGRDSLASSLGREGSMASSLGPPAGGLLSHNSLSMFPPNQTSQLFLQDQGLNGHAYGGASDYPGQQARLNLGASNASGLGMPSLTSTPLQGHPTHSYLQGVTNRSGTPVNSQSVSPSYGRGFGQAGLALGQGYSQAFPSPLSTKGLAPPGLGGRVGAGLGNAIGPSSLAQLGASGLGNHLSRTTGLNPHVKGTGVFNLPASQPVAPRFQSQIGQGMGAIQRIPNGVGGYGVDGRSTLVGPPGQAMAPSSAAQNFGASGLDLGPLKQRQMLQELQAQQRLMQQSKSAPFGQQQAHQPTQAQVLLERREQLRQLMQQGLLDLTPQQLQQFQAQQLLLNQHPKAVQQQGLWPNRAGSPGLNQAGLLNANAGNRLFQR